MTALGNMIHVVFVGVLLLVTPTSIRGDFVLVVNLVNYTNPTGLCAECQTRLFDDVSTADQLVPVCCDDMSVTSENCNNTGEERCDTRFRWRIREYGSSLDTRPTTVLMAEGTPPYNFTDCSLSDMCPSSEMSFTFGQGQDGFLGVTSNPLFLPPSSLRNFNAWTGRIQFLIEAVDSRIPNIIDSLLVNLDLQLGADFTEERTYSGYHNISHMTMSFRVECNNGFCGQDCTATMANNNNILSCETNGDVVCIKEGFNRTSNCNSCLHNLNFTTNCTTCLQANFDPDSNCTACLPGYNISTGCSTCISANYDPANNCSTCLAGYNPEEDCDSCIPLYDLNTGCTTCLTTTYDPATNCSTCLAGPRYDTVTNCSTCVDPLFDPDNGCTSCLAVGYDPQTNCTQCLTNRDIDANCTVCLSGWSIDDDCNTCLPGYDMEANCTQCLPNREQSSNCTVCLPGWSIDDDCNTCLPGYDMEANCTQCLPNRELSNNCTVCLPGWDINADCLSCLPRRDPTTNCTLCLQPERYSDTDCNVCILPGGDPETQCTTCRDSRGDPDANCTIVTEPTASLSVPLVAGIAGGVGGTLLIVIILLILIVLVLVCQVRRRGHAKFNVSDRGPVTNPYNLEDAGNGTGSSIEHKFQNPIYGPGMELNSKPEISSPDGRMITNSLYEDTVIPGEEDYSQLRHPSVSPPSHKVKTGTNPRSSGPMYDSAYPEPREGTPIYDSADCKDVNQPVGSETGPRTTNYSRLNRHPTETSITLQPVPPTPIETYSSANFPDPNAKQPVYAEANFPPETHVPGPESKARHQSKSRAPYEEIDNDLNLSSGDKPSGVYDKAYTRPTPSMVPAPSAYSKLEGPTLNAYSELGGPTSNQYARLDGSGADNDTYNVANNRHPQLKPQQVAPNGMMPVYDTANYPSAPPAPQQVTYDYADTPLKDPHPDFSVSSSMKHSYDYVDTPLTGMESTPAPLVRPSYTNTMPGRITAEAESHYDLGQ